VCKCVLFQADPVCLEGSSIMSRILRIADAMDNKNVKRSYQETKSLNDGMAAMRQAFQYHCRGNSVMGLGGDLYRYPTASL
jgi:hypothetical protein